MNTNPILLIEDNPDDAELTIIGFRRCKIANDIIVARDGEEALTYLLNGLPGHPKEVFPALTILDLNLPRVSGLDVLRKIRENDLLKLLPVLILTTSTEEADVIESYSLGANAYVQKPIVFEDLVVAAERLGLFWLLLNVSPPVSRGSGY